MRLLLRVERPAPAPPAPTAPFPVVVVSIYVVWLVYLILAKFKRTMLAPVVLDNLWMCWPVALTIFLSAQYELTPLSADSTVRDLSDPIKAVAFALPIAGFGQLLLSEMAVWLVGYLGPRRRFAALRHPVMSVHAITLLFYVFEPGQEAIIMFDAFGRPLHPLRYVLWTISVSSMCFAMFLVVDAYGGEGRTRGMPRLLWIAAPSPDCHSKPGPV